MAYEHIGELSHLETYYSRPSLASLDPYEVTPFSHPKTLSIATVLLLASEKTLLASDYPPLDVHPGCPPWTSTLVVHPGRPPWTTRVGDPEGGNQVNLSTT